MPIVPLRQNRSEARPDLSQPRQVGPARIRPLATLPVFFSLNDKRAVVIGGSDAAAWKAELLAAAGANVEVQADELSDTMLSLIGQATKVDGTAIRHVGPFDTLSLAGAAVIVADAEDEALADNFYAAAKHAGVPINIIDRPGFSDFQFGSIVNRSPVVVGISTDGAAPILGQAIRQRIETLLPPALADWAALAQRLRTDVMARLSAGRARRAFWEALSQRAFGPSPSDTEERQLRNDLGRLAQSDATEGRVTLVGAGPGEAELLTLKAVRALQAADVILFDDLVSDDVLELARREAKRILVGKRGGRESCSQDEINDTMIALAKAGRHVVRLKSGDPSIFGRAGEETTILQQAGIAVEIVPGITAAAAMAAALGVSLTHRDLAQSVRFVTAHRRKGVLPLDLDWAAVADPQTTTIFYMGGGTAGEIADRLIGHGLSPATPVAVASGLSRPQERRAVGVLADLAAIVAELGRDQPILIGVGGVFAAARQAVGSGEARSADASETEVKARAATTIVR